MLAIKGHKPIYKTAEAENTNKIIGYFVGAEQINKNIQIAVCIQSGGSTGAAGLFSSQYNG
ncbi:hypothetical protein CMT41_18355 [Colwellia sp. MT41]|uniref:hypothetical protein n=1 Tax=Colwellia sp. MT41 TaxID=58049 RepID=UPI000717AC5B|nr:hypothetical protein [Colwellia sp. MT41]ALO36486.1 hypothetical protein CMT41_18355 [Colwellia sp. MT41]